MSNIPSNYDNEINLIDLIANIWDGRWKILSIIAVSLLLVFTYNINRPIPTFTATTNIKSITSFELEKFRPFNSYLKLIEKKRVEHNNINNRFQSEYGILPITQNYLLNLYIEYIEKSSLLEIAIDRFNLLNKENYESKRDYNLALQKFASDIKILKPKEKASHHILKVKYNNEDKWADFLAFINDEANRKVKTNIIENFNTTISSLKQRKNFAVKDLDKKIENTKKYYDRYIKNRLAFLAEQAAIARKLDIKKNLQAPSTFSSENTTPTNFKIHTPSYLIGYLPIEEEMKQIKIRKDKSAFIKNLYKLEQQKKELETDQTIERAINLFNKTPLYQNDFKVTIVKVASTNYEIKNNSFLPYILAIFLGAFIGVVYVQFTNSFQNRKNTIVS